MYVLCMCVLILVNSSNNGINSDIGKNLSSDFPVLIEARALLYYVLNYININTYGNQIQLDLKQNAFHWETRD